MKHSVRLMLFVALLLPFRGALAVSGWLCHVDMSPSTAVTAYQSSAVPMADMNHDVDHGGCHGAAETGDHTSSHNPACDLCSSICGAPAFPSSDAQFRGLMPPGAERFAAIARPHAEFAVGGLERPPRTI